jgi:hypothetical protein
VSDLELNGLLFCHKPEGLQVLELPGLLEQWINRTHGTTPEERDSRSVSLFFCLTQSDRFLEESVGQSDLIEKIENKLSVFEKFSYLFKEWGSGAFGNCFAIRNPSGARVAQYFEYDKEKSTEDQFIEAGYVEAGKDKLLTQYAGAF